MTQILEDPIAANFLQVPVCVNGKAAFINKSGNIVLQTNPDYENVSYFSDGLARFKEKGKYGFFDETGSTIIKPLFDSVQLFSEGFAQIHIDEKSGFIDKTGELVIPPVYDKVEDFANGLALAGVKNGEDSFGFPNYKLGFIDRTGAMTIGRTKTGDAGKFDDAGSFSENLAPVKIGDRWGYLDELGQTVIRFRFKQAKPFSEGMAPVSMNGRKWGYIDNTGQFVISPQFTAAEDFSEGLAAVSTHRNGFLLTEFIDRAGNTVFKIPDSLLVQKFKEGMTSFVCAGTEKGTSLGSLIDKEGRIIFQRADTLFMPFIDGAVAFRTKGFGNSYIDRTGAYIWNAEESE